MGIEGIWIGHGIEVSYVQLAKKLGVKIKKLSIYDSIEKITEHLNTNPIDDLQLCVLKKSHSYDRSDDENDDHDDESSNIYFGMFMKIGDHDCWNHTKLSVSDIHRLHLLLADDSFNSVCLNFFKKSPTLMTVVSGCPCCS